MDGIGIVLSPELKNGVVKVYRASKEAILVNSRPVDTGGRGQCPPNNLPNLFLEML